MAKILSTPMFLSSSGCVSKHGVDKVLKWFCCWGGTAHHSIISIDKNNPCDECETETMTQHTRCTVSCLFVWMLSCCKSVSVSVLLVPSVQTRRPQNLSSSPGHQVRLMSPERPETSLRTPEGVQSRRNLRRRRREEERGGERRRLWRLGDLLELLFWKYWDRKYIAKT